VAARRGAAASFLPLSGASSSSRKSSKSTLLLSGDTTSDSARTDRWNGSSSSPSGADEQKNMSMLRCVRMTAAPYSLVGQPCASPFVRALYRCFPPARDTRKAAL